MLYVCTFWFIRGYCFMVKCCHVLFSDLHTPEIVIKSVKEIFFFFTCKCIKFSCLEVIVDRYPCNSPLYWLQYLSKVYFAYFCLLNMLSILNVKNTHTFCHVFLRFLNADAMIVAKTKTWIYNCSMNV